MEEQLQIEVDHGFFSTRRYDEVVVFSFKENIFRHASNLQDRDLVQSYFARVSRSKGIKVIVVDSSQARTGCEEYLGFFDLVKRRWDRNDIRRLCNIINQLILTLADLNKIVIHATSGRVISLFLNLSLACDYRIIADNTLFQNPYLDLGLLSKGGGAFFLSRMLGPSKAYEVLLLKREIPAEEALRLGIVDRVVPPDLLEEAALEVAHGFGANRTSSLAGIKRLVSFSMRDLRAYLDYENQEIFRIVDSADFAREVSCR